MNNKLAQENSATRIILPLFLDLVTPPFAMLLWYTNVNLDGSFVTLWHQIVDKGFFTVLNEVWFSRFFGTQMAWKIIGLFMLP